MIHMEGEKTIPLPVEQVYAKLTDMQFLASCVPDVHETKEVKDKTASLVLRPGFAFVRGEMHMHIEKLEETPVTAARFVFRTKGIGSTADVETRFTLAAQDAGTVIRWQADVTQLTGLIKAVPRGLIQGAAQKIVTDMLKAIEEKIAEST